MSKKSYKEIKKHFDHMVYEIVKKRTLSNTDEVDDLIRSISPQIDLINNIISKNSKFN